MLDRERLLTNPERTLSFESSTPGSNAKIGKETGSLMNNWIFLVLMAMLSFSSANLCISKLSELGIKMVFYYGSGSLLICAGFFINKSCKPKLPNAAVLDDPNAKRELLWTKEGRFDWRMLLCLLAAVAV